MAKKLQKLKNPQLFQSIRGSFNFILITFNEMGKKIIIARSFA